MALHRRLPPPHSLFQLLLVSLAVHLVWVLMDVPPTTWSLSIANLGNLPAYLFSALLTLSASRKADDRSSGTWKWLGYAMASWGLGSGLYFLLDTVLHIRAFPSLPDVFYLLALPFITVGLLKLRREQRGGFQTLSLLVDMLLIVLIAGNLMWVTSVHSTLSSYPGQPLTLAVALAYPTGDLLLCAMTVTLALWRPLDLARRELILLAGGMASFLVTDVIYAYQQGQSVYHIGTLLDAGWTLAAVFIGWTAYANIRACSRAPVSLVAASQSLAFERWTPLLPHFAVLAAFTFYISFYLRAPRPDLVQSGVFASVIILFILRQILVLTDNQRLHLQLTHRAEHDVLTGARNRADLELRLQRAIAAAQRGHQLVAVLFVDLDRMKLINDTFGHSVGDLVLREVVARLKAQLGSWGDLTRFGGDEFIVILSGLETPGAAASQA